MLSPIFSLDQIVSKIQTKIGSLSTTLTDFTPGGPLRAIIDSFSAFIEYIQFQITQAFESFYISGAKLTDLDNRVKDFGLTRKLDIPAHAVVSFNKNIANTNQFTIPAGTIVSTQPDSFGNTINYTLDTDLIYVVGVSTATGNVTCTIVGTGGNVASGMITNISSSVPGIDTITNLAASTDGASAETDQQLRARVPIQLNGYKMGNGDAIRSAVLAIPGITLAKLVENNPLPGYIIIYVSNQSGILTTAQLNSILAAATSVCTFGMNISLVAPTITYVTVTLDAEIDTVNYDVVAVTNALKTGVYNFIQNNASSKLQIYDLFNAASVPGVHNLRNIQINGSPADLISAGFSVSRMADQYNSTIINILPLVF